MINVRSIFVVPDLIFYRLDQVCATRLVIVHIILPKRVSFWIGLEARDLKQDAEISRIVLRAEVFDDLLQQLALVLSQTALPRTVLKLV